MKNLLFVVMICHLLISIAAGKDKTAAEMQIGKPQSWPVLKSYDQQHLARLALPIGGIGTGTISLMGNGALRHWEIINRPAKGFHGTPSGNRAPFFAVYMHPEGKEPVSRALMGPLEYFEYESSDGTGADNHGLPRFRNARFDAAYPFGQVYLSDTDVPVDVKLQAFNPFIPGDADASGIPIVILRYVLTNKTNSKVRVSVCGSFENFIGADGSNFEMSWKNQKIPSGAKANRNKFRQEEKFSGLYLYSEGVDKDAEQYGTMALAALAGPDISYRTSLERGGWGNDLLDFWDDFSADGRLTEKPFTGGDTPRASLASAIELEGKETKAVTFFISWHFPNRFAWAPVRVGNYYTAKYTDAWDVLNKALPQLAVLEQKSIEFVNAFVSSDYPDAVKEAALFNLSTLRTQTCFRTEDGFFYGWEGCNDNSGCCMGSCTHVWNYEQAVAFLFGDLAKLMREIEFGHAVSKNGLMSFRVNLPLKNAQYSGVAAADGQLGTIMKMYRDWQLSGDDEQLKRLWPYIKKAAAFCWIEGGWDGNIDGVMEGCQHNTMDVEYYGPNPQMQFWYLGALRAAEEMARYLGDNDFAENCSILFANSSKWTDENLFNGEYYEHIVMPPDDPAAIAPGLSAGMGASDYTDPDYQLARGCLVDQLTGQYMAHICGLGYLGKPQNIKKTLKGILKYNSINSVHNHFNNMRSYVLGNESALLMAAYPFERPKNPFPYFNEVMTGFEYTAAIGMLYEGLIEDGLNCIQNIRSRYDGRKRSPFDEAECGHHYARAMASWASVLALSGFQYSAPAQSLYFNPVEGEYFWSNGYAHGTIVLKKQEKVYQVNLKVLAGKISFQTFGLNGFGQKKWDKKQTIIEGQNFQFTMEPNKPEASPGAYKIKSQPLSSIARPPVIKNKEGRVVRLTSFSDSVQVSIESESGHFLRFTLDGSDPADDSQKYTGPITIKESCTLKAAAFKNSRPGLRSTTAKFYKFTSVKNITLNTPASSKYPGHGEVSLVDGLRGSMNYRDGNWLGFEETDLEVIIDLGEMKKISRVTAGCLQEQRSWVFLPLGMTAAVSIDGKKYTQAAEINLNKQGPDVNLPGTHDIKTAFKPVQCRFVKVTLKNTGRCPAGHPGAGGKAWLFVDEISIE